MEVVYHPLVKQDVIEALKYYAEISPRLANEFEYEVRLLVSQAATNPLRFHPTERASYYQVLWIEYKTRLPLQV